MPNKGILSTTKARNTLAILGVIFFAANLRAPLTSVGPVIGEISLSLSLSKTAAGMLTTIPLLAFGLLSSFIPRISQRFGMELVLFFSLVLLGIGLSVRSLGSITTLFIGAALVGTAITFGNVLMPAFIKTKFPKRIGVMMGVYSVGMNLTAALAAGLSIGIGKWTNLGWKASIGIWVVLTIVGIIIWFPQLLFAKREKKVAAKDTIVDPKPIIKVNLLKSRIAWAVTIYMGLQSLMYYCLTAWLPKVAQDWGMSIEASGWVLAYVQFAQLPTTFIGSIIAARMRDQRFLSALTGILFILGITGILIFKTKYILLWCILLGVASGLAFSLSMLFFVLRTQNTLQAAKLSGMAQSFGYLIAATGPAIFGGIFDLTSSWTLSFVFLMLMSVVLLVAGVIAGKDSWVS